MYKIITVLLVLIFFAACHGGGIGMDTNATVNRDVGAEEQMEELSVEFYNTYEETQITKTIDFNAGRLVNVLIEEYEIVGDKSELVDSCTDSSELSEDDYQSLINVVLAANLLDLEESSICSEEYENPTPGYIPGPLSMRIYYKTLNGRGAMVQVPPCSLDQRIEDLKTTTEDLANKYVPTCTEDELLTD